MLTRLLALLLLAMTLAASAQTVAPALPLTVPEPADWKALVCGLLVIAYMARRRSRWLAG